MATVTAPVVDTVAPDRNFSLSLEERLRAFVQGVPGYIRRRRRIEDLEAQLVEKLVALEAAGGTRSSPEIDAGLTLLNELIVRHNRYYPIEANLPVDVRTGRLIDRGAPWRPLPLATAPGLVARARSGEGTPHQ
jgi:hypothetical protein